MKKLLLPLLFVTLFWNNSVAQNWSYYKDFPVNIKPVDIDINNAGTLFMLSSDSRFFYKLQNQDWQEMPGFPVANPECISVDKNSNRMYFGDFFQGLVFTDDFGQTWQQTYLTTDPISGWHEPVFELSNITNSNLFFGGSSSGFDPTIIRYTNNGLNGEIILLDPNNIPNEIFTTNSNVVLIGTANAGIWKSANNGSTFQQTNQNEQQFFRFTEGTNGTVYTLGYNNTLNQVFLLSSNDYMNWTSVTLPNTTDKYTSIVFDNATQSLWLGSETGLYKSDSITTTAPIWNASTFNNTSQFTVEIVNSGSNIYNFTAEFIAQKLNPAGNAWNAINQGLKGIVHYAGFGLNNKLFSSSYSSNTISAANSEVAPWSNTIITGNAPSVSNMFVKPNGKIYLNMGFSLKKSIDNGLTYTDITPPDMIYSFWRFEVGENNSLFAVKYAEREILYRSTDDGLTWSMFADFTSNIPFDPAVVQSISEDTNGVIYVTTESSDISQGINRLRYTTNQGITWDTITYDASQTIGSCGSNPTVFTIGNKTFFNACDMSFRVNINNANPLEQYIFPWGELGFLGFGGIKINSQGHQYLLGDVLYKSIDNGATWIDLGRPSELINGGVDMNGVYIDNNDNVFIMSSSHIFLPAIDRGFYKLTETFTRVENPNFENSISIFPNPAQNIINIQTQEAIKEVAVYDVLGKKVRTIQIPTSTIDVSNLAHGLYIVKVIAENGKTASLKFVKN